MNIKRKLFSAALAVGLLLVPSAAMAEEQIAVTLPAFPVTLNGVTFDQSQLEYPLLVYNDITYVAMTYHDARLLGLETAWTQKDGLSIEKAAAVPEQLEAQKQYVPYVTDMVNKSSYSAVRPNFAINVNGKAINNSKEEYPLLVFRNVTYFPLTWRFAVNEFGWNYTFDAKNGLNISPVPTPAAPEMGKTDKQNKTVMVTGDLVNLRSGAGINNRVVGQVTAGLSLTVLGSAGDTDGKVWYQIETVGDTKGWIASWLVKEVQTSAPTNNTVADGSNTNNIDNRNIFVNGTTIYVTGDLVNLRQGAGTNYERGGQVLEGDALTVVGSSKDRDGKVWYQIQMEDGARLWIASWLVSDKKAEAAADVSTGVRTAAELRPVQQDGRKTVFAIKNGEGNIYSIKKVSDTQLQIELDNVLAANHLTAAGNGFTLNVTSLGSNKAAAAMNYTMGSYVDIEQQGDWLILNCYSTNSGLAGKTIVLDPGHGGADPGAQGITMKQVTDADIGYTVACKLKSLLEQNGVEVVFTRGDLAENERVFMTERIEMSNGLEPDIFISIHANSTDGQTTATGAETYTYNGKCYTQQWLAENLAEKIAVGLGDRTGEKSMTKTKNLYVLRMNNHPSVLVETGYLSNPHDEALLATDAYRQKLAEGIYNGVVEYFEQF